MVKKRDRSVNENADIERFACGAEPQFSEPSLVIKDSTSKKCFKRLTFSLTDKEDKLVDTLSLKPNTFRCNRSQVIKAALAHLASLDDQSIINILEQQQ